jgi:hypothetical protein
MVFLTDRPAITHIELGEYWEIINLEESSDGRFGLDILSFFSVKKNLIYVLVIKNTSLFVRQSVSCCIQYFKALRSCDEYDGTGELK